MKIFNKYDCCRGITIFSWGRFRVEIWYVPAGYAIPEHSHPLENDELMFLLGKTTFFRKDMRTGLVESLKTNWKMFGKCFTINFFHSHWFEKSTWPLVFINFQSFFNAKNKTSAAEDFHLTT